MCKGYKCYHPVSKKIMASRHVFDESVFPYKTSPTSTATQPSSHTLLVFYTWIPCSDFNSVAGNTVTAPVPPCLSPLPRFTIPTLALQASDATLSQESRHNLQLEALPLVPQVEGEQSVEEEAHWQEEEAHSQENFEFSGNLPQGHFESGAATGNLREHSAAATRNLGDHLEEHFESAAATGNS